MTTSHTDHELVMRVMPMPADVNANGDIFGGWIMEGRRHWRQTQARRA
jgi:acyl-CoA thioesterase YciA